MSDNIKRQPLIRFKSFTDDWEQRKIEDLAQITMGQSPNGTNYTNNPNDHILVQGNADMKNGRVVPRVWTAQVTKTAEAGDTIFSVRAPVGDVGITDYDIVIGRGVAGIKCNDFIFQILTKMKSDGYWTKLSTGSTFESINSNDLKEAKFNAPNLDEQLKIGQFFKTLDDTIALHQRELELLNLIKKGFLQKLFPENDSQYPELRFHGFTEPWEQCKLSEVSTHRGGTAIEKYFSMDGKYKVISIGSYNMNSEYNEQNLRALSNEITDKRVVKANELTMVLNDKTSTGEIIGRCLLIKTDNEYVVNQRTEIISPNKKLNSQFAYISMNGPFREKIKKIVQGGTQIYVNYSSVENLKIELPQKDEQSKIGELFKTLDDTITLNQRKLELLKKMKTSFLQQMFI